MAAVMAAAVSCVKEQEGALGTTVPMTFIGYSDDSSVSSTKTSLGEGFSVLWDEDDHIKVFSGDGKGVTFSDVTVDETGKVATFKGDIALADNYHALYPAQEDAVFSSETESVTAMIPTVQEAVAENFADGVNLAFARSSAGYLRFLNVGAIVGVQCPSAYSPSSIMLVSRDPEVKMSGKATISYNDGNPVAVPAEDAASYVEFKGGFNASSYRKIFYFVVYPGEYKSGFDIKIKNAAGTHQYIASAKEPLTLKRNDNFVLFNPAENYGFGWNAPVEPENVTAVLQGLEGVSMTWECKAASELCAGYNIYVRQSGSAGNGELKMSIADAKQLSCLVQGLEAGKTYDFGVQAAGAEKKKDSYIVWVPNVSVPVPDNCLDPSNLKIEQTSDTEVTLTWNDNSGAEAGYRVYKKTGSDVATADIAAGSTSYTFKWLAGGNVHDFGVQARGAYGNHSKVVYYGDYKVLTWEELLEVDMGWQECLLPEIKYITQDSGTSATITWTCGSGAETGFNLYVRRASETAWSKSHLIGTHDATSSAAEEGTCTFTGLTSGVTYIFGVQAQGSTAQTSSAIASVEYAMVNISTSKYSWESARSGAPEFADMTLCYGGNPARVPRYWDKDRWEKSVVYTDENGQDHWFFDSFLALETESDGHVYSIANTSTPSAGKKQWSQQLSYWFDSENGFQALDDCIDEAIATAGAYPHKRYVIFSLPDPIYCYQFANKSSSTTYWGKIDGSTLDFSSTADRVKAYKWMVDQVRARFAAKNYRHIELAGFYILSESFSETYNSKYKKFTTVIPEVAAYCDKYNEGLYWIPYGYSTSDSGHNSTVKNWADYDLTAAVLQPNYYWESDRSWDTICNEYIKNCGMGMEYEFEGTHGESLSPCSSILSKRSDGTANSRAEINKARFRAYMIHCKDKGLYGNRLLVLYSGSNALYELAVSTDYEDKTLYHEMGKFFINSPLKK